jgi:hypothetical protein
MCALAVLSDGTLAVGNHRIDLYANGVRIYEMPAIYPSHHHFVFGRAAKQSAGLSRRECLHL